MENSCMYLLARIEITYRLVQRSSFESIGSEGVKLFIFLGQLPLLLGLLFVSQRVQMVAVLFVQRLSYRQFMIISRVCEFGKEMGCSWIEVK